MKQLTRSAALIAATGVVLGLALPAGAADGGAKRAEALKWTECEGEGLDPRQRCATVSVPMDYSEPHGRKIDLVISRIPSENPAARRGALLMIPGGPGGDSLSHPSDEGQKMPQEVRDAYDLIGFTPRGNAPSTAVSCDLETSDLAFSKLRPWPAADGSVTENMITAQRMSDACAENGGELIRHISTKNEARDIDRIRAALGERKLSAWGVSYGTYVASAYVDMFPHRTDRIVMDSNDHPDPVHAERAWLAAFEQGVEDVFPEFAKWASRPGNPDRVARTPQEVRSRFLELADRLDREPLPWPGANPPVLNGTELRQAMLTAFYDPDDFPSLARLIRAAEKGTVPPAPPSPPEELLQNYTAVGAGTICNDAAWPSDPAVYQKDVTESRAKYPLTAGMPRNAMLCAAWPFPPKEAPVTVSDRGPSNILLIQNERDVATPLSGALKLREALGRRAVMVVNDSTGHDAYLINGTPCGDGLVSRFLATGERPKKDVYCD
ncbi:secreted protein [Streptomyces davaonensis JCM 4913]|uniref:Secreted protein n=1 Tax=Streptomyces davaonensis (strain DSM 101723 / JCM 4913 / KCC S-0913 / 768) TaxID=1214101 RepID=K4R1L6_STRDJ|nr:alpha/beta hydrolase [Streptomyces davaonensis]CCK30171.1 secreted protein [Streptomyces davaonensis JCM 4913]